MLGQASGERLAMGQLFGRLKLGAHHFTVAAQGARLWREEGLPSSIKRDFLGAGRFTYGFDSPLGPLELTYARGNAGGEFYFNLGHWF